MKLKPGVKVRGIRPEIILALMAAQDAYGSNELVVTSVCDGKHSWGSLHYAGCAVDLRTRHLTVGTPRRIANQLKADLGDEYDVVLEDTHLHLEWNPKE